MTEKQLGSDTPLIFEYPPLTLFLCVSEVLGLGKQLLLGDVIAPFYANTELLLGFVGHGDLYWAVLAIREELVRLVGDYVLAAELFLNVMKSIGQILKLEREEGAAAGGLCEHFQVLVSLVNTAAGEVGADGVDDDLGALGHVQGFLSQHAALVIIAV